MLLRFCACFLFTLAPAWTQTVTGSLEGHVSDTSGGIIPGAKVTAQNLDTGLIRKTVTNEEGYYQLTFLPIGSYTIQADAPGFGATQRSALVELDTTHGADLQLKPASIANEVTVMDEVPLIETARGEIKSTIDEKTMEDRPLPSRNFLSLIEQLPGFQSSGGYNGVNNPTLSSGSYVVFNGTGSRSATFQIDGVNNDDSSEGINRQNVNISSIKELSVLTNAYSAEFGRGGAVVLVQTKSGTNKLQGDAYEYLQNEKLNSNAFYNNALGSKPDGSEAVPRAPYRRNQFGYTVGGPLIKKKLFLFHSFEQTKLVQYNTFRRFIFLPTEKVQIGTCRLCLNPADHPNIEADRVFLQSVIDRFPKAAPNATSVCDHCYVETKPAYYPDQDYSGKLDWNISERDTLAARYQYSRQHRTPYDLIIGENADQNNRQQNAGLTSTHMFNASTWGEFRFGLGLRVTLVDISSGNSTPIVRISNPSVYTTTSLGSAGQFPINRRQTDYQYNYNLSHVHGKHILRAGIDYRRQHLDDLADNYSRGFWTFGATGSLGSASRYEGYENFLRGFVTDFQRGYGNFTTYNRLGESNQYLMDDIKVAPTFTLNLGFRYEYVLKPSERDHKIDYGYSNFGGYEPRFGFAWAPSARIPLLSRILGEPGKFSIRGGFGIYHTRIFQSVFSQGGASVRSLPPYGVFRDFGSSFATGDPGNGFSYTPGNFDPGRISIVRIAPDLGMPSIQQYNLTVDRQLPGKISMSVGYNRTRGVGLLQNALLNRARFPFTDPTTGILYDKVDPDLGDTSPPPGFISEAQPRTNQRRPDPKYSSIYYINNGAWSYYNALRLEVKRRYSKGLQWQLAYAFSKSIDTGSDVTAGSPLTEFGSSRSLRALSDFDQRHRLNLNYSYLLPWFNKGRGILPQALGGWTISGNNTFASGNPFSVSAGYDINADGVSNDRPILIDQSLFGASVDNGRQDPASGKIISTLQFPASAFYPTRATPTKALVFDPGGSDKDSIGRNTFFGAGIKTWDLAALKSFRITESHRLTFRAEMYNVTNSPRFGLPVTNLQSASFGVISSTYNPQNFVGASRSDATSRVIQLALRYVF